MQPPGTRRVRSLGLALEALLAVRFPHPWAGDLDRMTSCGQFRMMLRRARLRANQPEITAERGLNLDLRGSSDPVKGLLQAFDTSSLSGL